MAVLVLYEPLTHERTFVVMTGGTAGVSGVMVLQCFPRCGGGMAMTFSTLSWGPCTDLNGWFNLNLATVTRLLAGIKQWTLFVVCIVECFCMLCFGLPGLFPLTCTLSLYSAVMPIHLHSAPHFKVGVQCTGAVVIYIIECLVTTSDLAKCFLLKCILQCLKALLFRSGSLNYSLYFPVD